jgi:SWI/SNF-related matrix-associated actin-dependent regulator of chromatin subfamily A member 2/4
MNKKLGEEETTEAFTEQQKERFRTQMRFLLLREITLAPSKHAESHSRLWTEISNGALFGFAFDANKEKDEIISRERLPWRLAQKLIQETANTCRNEEMRMESVSAEPRGMKESTQELKRLFEEALEKRVDEGCESIRERVVKQRYMGNNNNNEDDGINQDEWKVRQTIRIKSLKLLNQQKELRRSLIEEQRKIMQLPERQYKKMVKQDEKQRELEMKLRSKKEKKELSERWRLLAQTRKRLIEEASARQDLLTQRNRAMVKLHEKMARSYLVKSRDDALERAKRMEALKSNDLEAYKKLLAEAAKSGKDSSMLGTGAGGTGGSGADGDENRENKYEALQEFLTQTEGYLEKLGGKIASVKISQARSEAATEAAAKALAEGLDEDEIKEAAEKAAREATLANGEKMKDRVEGNNGKDNYYAVAHSEQEIITEQPKMLTFGQLRDYQIVSLQWMVSLHNNRLNGILADEMGLGKTVQVCSLIAYLWESKQNFGPHIIIVPNAVIVNWKAELKRWLPKVNCVYYVGNREQRTKIFQKQVLQLKFNVLVTTYEFIMRDRSKLAKVSWKYIIIDEAQRLKDREGKLSRDLDKFRAQRRLLLTGTPLQNDLSELWSLLNLLLPDVFDSAKIFQQWFGKKKAGDNQTQKKGIAFSANGNDKSDPIDDEEDDDWMEREKKVIVVSRLHQILEPFMLRRLVQDVESKLPPRKSVVVHCPFSAFQSNAYSWVNYTGSIRVEPYTRLGLAAQRTFRGYLPLNNRCVELRKICNHPSLSYPPHKGGDFRGVNLIRSCGKLWILDRLLVKLSKTGHKVLLFSTMTKLLDVLEVYLKWRQTTEDGENLQFCRIDGSTPLDQREIAINDFNRNGSNKFIFLLSIRAAGRGLNLQTADTVVMYDPDPNPKNEEQAIARSHRIGQMREVRVIHLEALDDKEISTADLDHHNKSSSGWGGDDRMYCESVESVVRNVIQQQKIEMADEVINAGRFDGQTTQSERRETLEKLMADQAKGIRKEMNVPSIRELNEKVCRSEEELKLWNELDETLNWPSSLMGPEECPDWIRYTKDDLDDAIESAAKSKAGEVIVPINTANLGRGGRSMNKFIADSAVSFDQMDIDANNVQIAREADERRSEFVDRTGLQSTTFTAEQMSSKVKGGDGEDAFAIPTTKALLPFQKKQLAAAAADKTDKQKADKPVAEEGEEEGGEDFVEQEEILMGDSDEEEDDYGEIEEEDDEEEDVDLDNLVDEEDLDEDEVDGDDDSIEEVPVEKLPVTKPSLKFTFGGKKNEDI